MSLGELLFALRELIERAEPEWNTIVRVLAHRTELAEYEVARFYAATKLPRDLDARVRDRDHRVRRDAIALIRTLLPRGKAATFLRPLVKDPHPSVRGRARRAVRELGIADVALPDTRFYIPPDRKIILPTHPGAWNPTGWAFGVYRRNIRAPGRPNALTTFGLPPLETAADVAKLAGVDPAKLPQLMRPGTGQGSPYVSFAIAKANGGERAIAAPRATLRKAQRTLLRELLDKLPAHPAAHGFVRGRSIATNAEPHVRARVIVKIDLQDFFPTVHYRRVEGLFRRVGYPARAAAALAGLCTYRPVLEDGLICWPGVLPQGAPTSPAIANLVCRRLDGRLSGLAKKAGARYTRYADDLTFSFHTEVERKTLGRFLWWVDQICQQEGFQENARKRRVLRPSNAQRVAGVIVNSGLFVPRELRRRLRAILANVKKNGVEVESRGDPRFQERVLGLAAYVNMVQPEAGAKLLAEARAVFAKKP